MAWSGVFGTMTVINLAVWLAGQRPDGPADIVLLAAIASLPLGPIVGFHLNQAYRQFRAGHTLAELKAALGIARRERAETEALARNQGEPPMHRVLRLATTASATWLAVTFGLILQGTIHENRTGLAWLLVPVLATMGLGALSNALDVQFIPTGIRAWWQTGIRDRLWNSRAGEWLARRLGAPERSRLARISTWWTRWRRGVRPMPKSWRCGARQRKHDSPKVLRPWKASGSICSACIPTPTISRRSPRSSTPRALLEKT